VGPKSLGSLVEDRQQARVNARRSRGFPIVGAAVVLVLAALAVTLTHPAVSARTRVIVVDGALFAGFLCAALSCARAAVRSPGRLRLAWSMLLLTVTVWVAGNLTRFNLRILTDAAAFPSLADAFFIAAILAGAIGLLAFPLGRPRRVARARSLLDAFVVGGCLWFAGTASLPPAASRTAGHDWLATTALLAYPIGDVILLILAIALLTHAPAGGRARLGVLATAFVIFGLADSTHAYLAASGTVPAGGVASLGWIGGYLLVALAALAPSATRQSFHESPPPAGLPIVGSTLVYGAFLIAVIAAAVHPEPHKDPRLAVPGVLVLLLLGARQALLAVDAEALRLGLERVAAQRGAELSAVTRRLHRVLDAVEDGVFGIDVHGRLTFANQAGARLLGYPAGRLVGLRMPELFPWTSPGAPDESPVARALRERTVIHASGEVVRHGDAMVFGVEYTVHPIETGDRVEGAVVAFRARGRRGTVERSTEEFMPDVERGPAPMLSADREAADLIALAVAETSQLAHAAQVRLVVGEVDGAVHADPDGLVQTLTNLVSNAVTVSPADADVTIGAEPQGDHVLFTVAHHGGDTSGTGPGLAFSKPFVERHGGRIWVESAQGNGSIVRFTLPAADRAPGWVTGPGEPAVTAAAIEEAVDALDRDPSVTDGLPAHGAETPQSGGRHAAPTRAGR
jgi:PAS domain S-box-containing protein